MKYSLELNLIINSINTLYHDSFNDLSLEGKDTLKELINKLKDLSEKLSEDYQ